MVNDFFSIYDLKTLRECLYFCHDNGFKNEDYSVLFDKIDSEIKERELNISGLLGELLEEVNE